MKQWNVAAYLRVSSDDGDKEESNSITNQKNLMKQFIKNNKDLKLYDFYIDDGFSGTSFDRPDFQRMLEAIKKEKINTVIVKDLSRLGRNYIEVGNYIEHIFPLYNVRLIVINDNLDSYKDPKSINNVIVPFKNLMNDEYARDISNKVRSVLDIKKENGEFIGTTAPYGYLKAPNNKYKFIIDKYASKVVKNIFKMAINGKSVIKIAEKLNENNILTPLMYKNEKFNSNLKIQNSNNLWNRRTIDRILNNKTYLGDLIQGKKKRISHKIHKNVNVEEEQWIIVPNHHEPIISKNDFEFVQNTIYSREIKINQKKEYDIFAGYLKCNDCGNSFVKRKRTKYECYYCSSYYRNKNCTHHKINKDQLINIVLKILNNHIHILVDIDDKINEIIEEENINYDFEILTNRAKDIQKKINKYNELKMTLKEDLTNLFINKTDYEEYVQDYNSILSKLEKELNGISDKLEEVNFGNEKNKEWIEIFKNNKDIKILNRNIVDKMIENIYIYEKGNVKIKFKYQNEYLQALDFINER